MALSRRLAVEVTLQDGRLFTKASVDPGRRFELVPIGPDRLLIRHMGSDLRFEQQDGQGRVSGATWTFIPQGTPEHPRRSQASSSGCTR